MALCLVCSLNFACNSPEVWVCLEFTSLELQRLWASLNVQVSELHAKLLGACRPSARARPRTQQSRACPRIRPRACPRARQRLPCDAAWGNCSIRAATRRRHAVAMRLMVQNPPSGPGCAVRRAHLSASAWAAGYETHPSRARRRCRASAPRHVPYPAFGPRRRRSVCREFTSGTNQGCLGVVADNDRTLGSGRL